ncbi:MAG TPA: lysophospholipid acyltransferase family protein [Propionibacteriaceae bacterium]|nr:lysophospholipid acyltransferase family protein [Propionibacteriaceae bacterium]
MTTHTGLALPRIPSNETAEPVYRGLAKVVRVIMPLLGTSQWQGFENLPQQGGIICVGNHISHFDPLVFGLSMIQNGRWPRYLGKVQIFRSPWLGPLARACGQIPVDRGSVRAADSLKAAEVAIAKGKAVTLYPEGTLTGDPDGWPMSARTGVARLALDTRAPVIPFGQWGAQDLMPDGKKGFPLVLGRRKKFRVICGEPVDLSDLYDLPVTREVLELATTRVMDAITALVEELRGDRAPADRWSFRTKRREPVVRTLRTKVSGESDDLVADADQGA